MAASYPYQAGVCNIGPGEVRKRARAGWLGLGIAAVLAVVLLALGAGRAWRAVLLLPLGFAAIGFVQASART
jgi:hypothetical protein